ncbi:hypothetical protein BDV38DRAFT_260352 [Aspergillus pseudotamarii]|uniref:Uncharacterized protein n=1 Tax=Aspergillus pseudotamarii TaxID=132259 RepID=A0A5N6SH47_ASPPS|nr:uncharacterized protein BDV38DRAFT_260352 [Aspergillus pseudotamarii]KAE8132723.1 hypothetical protein BDV38DRAFT_260352 [Aspergillus pseudotamarii]
MDFYCRQTCEDKCSGRHLFTSTKCPLISANFLREVLNKTGCPKKRKFAQTSATITSGHLQTSVCPSESTTAFG